MFGEWLSSPTDWITSIASLIAAAAAVAALFALLGVRSQIKLQRRQIKLELEGLYVSRYWKITDDLFFARTRTTARKKHLVRYLRLSEDQCDLRARGRITKSTWDYWRAGIVEQLEDREFKRILEAEPHGLYDHLRKLANDSSYDPRPAKKKWRNYVRNLWTRMTHR